MTAIAALAVLVMVSIPDEDVFSGPQIGESLLPFDVQSAFGKSQDDAITVANDPEKPVVVLFLHEKSRPAFGVSIATLKLALDRQEKLNHAFVYLTEAPNEGARWLGGIKRIFPSGVVGGVFANGVEGPEAYGLNRNVALTVLVANKGKVTANFALVQPSLEVDAPKIFKAISDALGEETVPDVADYGMRRMAASPDSRNSTGTPSPELRGLLRPLLNKNGSEDQIDAAAKKIVEYADSNAKARTQIGDIARRIVDSGRLSNYGNEFTQAYLKQWAKDFPAANKPEEKKKRRPKAETGSDTDSRS